MIELDCKKCDELKTKGYQKEIDKLKADAVEMAEEISENYVDISSDGDCECRVCEAKAHGLGIIIHKLDCLVIKCKKFLENNK